MRTTILAAMLYLGLASPVQASAHISIPVSLPTVDPARTLIIDGPIVGNNLTRLAPQLMEMSQKDKNKPIDLVISSPGGELIPGYLFVNVMEAIKGRGTPIRCFVPTLAASMAFQLFLHCDERYGLENALFLWHGVRVTSEEPITQEVAAAIYKDLGTFNRRILGDLRANLGEYIDDRSLMAHFLAETLHTGLQLEERAPGFVLIYRYIPGLMEVMTSPTVLRASRAKLQLTPGSMMYIMPGVVLVPATRQQQQQQGK